MHNYIETADTRLQKQKIQQKQLRSLKDAVHQNKNGPFSFQDITFRQLIQYRRQFRNIQVHVTKTEISLHPLWDVEVILRTKRLKCIWTLIGIINSSGMKNHRCNFISAFNFITCLKNLHSTMHHSHFAMQYQQRCPRAPHRIHWTHGY